MSDKEIWELILKHKALIYKKIYKYTKNFDEVDDIWQDVAISLFYSMRKVRNTYMPVKGHVINAVKRLNKNERRLAYVSEEVLVNLGGVTVC
ncbi:sigma-70 family RNA polymerase sigma factor [Clostridium sp. JN-9]|uniref:sigma-70 family RNA polymerase sigma factor n=1 Tax=Clostridium sp. JN-9 TaxID=2507159 RepID=UPI000FFDFAE1|nr:sigma-70 family RNA polymerase sigma factor [Clostridium sp. JN-9]QAT39523.1 sigma-70 family RNA polymerase sigma factor [Clostridium sp. JN-9]